jgi:NADH dehydrogenase
MSVSNKTRKSSNDIYRLPLTNKKRVVIVGGGFAGLKLAVSLSKTEYQVLLIDQNNFHQFQPLYYQVATAGLEPSAIAFPFRKVFQEMENLHFRLAVAYEVDIGKKVLNTSIGDVRYDYLVLSLGADTNYYGMQNIERYALPMKSVSEALAIRNLVLENYEKAMSTNNDIDASNYMNIVVAGGGPTGVELAGAIAEMRKFVLPKDYPELNFDLMRVVLIEGSGKLLSAMSPRSSAKAARYLKDLDVIVLLNTFVKDFDGQQVYLNDQTVLPARNLIWAAGIKPNRIKGIPEICYHRSGRLEVNEYLVVKDLHGVFALGDMAYMSTEDYPDGHPQVAQTAIQQAKCLAYNLKRHSRGKSLKSFNYRNKGSMATIGRNKAVVDLRGIKFGGFVAWFVWMFVHLFSIIGVKNKMLIFINWAWNYFTYDQSLRLILRSKKVEE